MYRLINAIPLKVKYYCTCAFLDISQAFDRVNYAALLYKLKKKILSSSLFLLLNSHLTDRYYQIQLESLVSKKEQISTAVPRGGITSLLFNICT